jgi:hypothetical protein
MPSHCSSRWRQLPAFSVIVVVATVSSIFPIPSRAQTAKIPKDRIVFLNGDISTGELKSTGDDHVVFDGQLTGPLTYSWRDIKSIEVHTSTARAALRTNTLNPTLLTKVIDTGTDVIGPMESNVAQLKATAPPASPSANVVPHWGGSVSTQDTVTRATQDQYQVGGRLHASYETTEQEAWKHQIVSLDSSVSFSEGSKPGAPVTKNALYEGTLMYNVYLTNSELQSNFPDHYNSSFLLAIANGYHNLSLGIDAQQSYAFGFGWVRISRGKANKNGDQLTQVFGLQGDVRYSNLQLYAPGTTANLAGAALKESYSISIPWIGPKAKPLILAESLTTIPYFNDSRSLQIRGTAQFALPLTQRLSIGPSLVDDYFRNAPRGSKQNYLQPALNLTYNFGPLTQ